MLKIERYFWPVVVFFLCLLLVSCARPAAPESPLPMPREFATTTPSPTPFIVGPPAIGGPVVSTISMSDGISVSVAPDSPLPVTLVAVTAEPNPIIIERPTQTPMPAITPTPENIWHVISPIFPAGPAAPDGRTSQSAWRGLDQIDYSQIKPYDELRIGPGFYAGTLRPSVDYLIIRPAIGASGSVVFDGGRNAPLPECGQADWESEHLGDSYGIFLEGVTGVVIDGGPQRRIQIRNYRYGGIRLEPDTRAVRLRNMQIYENGSAIEEATGWRPARPGIVVGGADHWFDGMIIHDNGEDAIQSHHSRQNNLRGLVVSGSWLYNSRMHSRAGMLPYNHCTHTDGLQIYEGGEVANVVVSGNVIGPNVTNGVILGDKGTGAVVSYAIVHSNSFVGVTDNAILDNSPGARQIGWSLEENLILSGRY